MPAPRFCVACRHCFLQTHEYVCRATEGEALNLVTGEPIKLHAKPCTYERSPQGECGPEGKNWSGQGKR